VWTSGNATLYGPMPTHVIIPTRLPRPPRVCAFDPRPPHRQRGGRHVRLLCCPRCPRNQPTLTIRIRRYRAHSATPLRQTKPPSRHLRKLGPYTRKIAARFSEAPAAVDTNLDEQRLTQATQVKRNTLICRGFEHRRKTAKSSCCLCRTEVASSCTI
jgi:hypothetical protein